MPAQSTSTLTEGARRTKRSKLTTTKPTKTSPATRNIAGGSRSGRKWLSHLPPTAGISSNVATINGRRRLATARTAESNTRESKIDTIRSPPLTSSTKGKKNKSNARAISSSTVDKRWNLSGDLINSLVMLSEAKHLCSWSLGKRPQKTFRDSSLRSE